MFQKNLALVQKKFPRLYQQLTASNPTATTLEIGINQSRTGLPVAYIINNGRKVFLNSSYDPEQEARRWMNSNIDPKSSGSCILCGGGFFYHVKELLAAGFFKKLAVYEPNLFVLKACMNHIDFEPILQHDNLYIVTGSDFDDMARGVLVFFGAGILYSDANLCTKPLPGYLDLYGDEIGNFLGRVREQINLYQLNLTTLENFAKEWLFNSFKNLNGAITSPVASGFFGKFKSIPAVVVSAGPSLGKNIHLLKDIKEKVLIICGGSSIRAMVRNGILPHILVAVDSPEVNSKVYDDLDLRDVYLVHNCRFWYKSAAKFAGRKILFKADAEGIPELFITHNRGTEIGVLRSGFSVSHTAFDLAFQMGCDPIVLIGQDLSYSPDKKRYAEGQISDTIEFFEKENVKRNTLVMKDINGREVLTDYELNSFRLIFEMMIETAYQDKVRIINATEGGVPIKGAVNGKLADVIAEYCREDRAVGRCLNELYQEGMRIVKNHPIDAAGYCKKMNTILERASIAMAGLIDRMQSLRKRNFNSEFNPDELEPVLKKIASDYDLALNYNEYHLLLKDFHSSVLYVLKAQLDRLTELNTPEDYDKKMQIYLNIIINTKDVLDFTIQCIEDFLKESEPETAKTPPTAIDSSVDLNEYESRIKLGRDLPAISARLELLLKDQNATGRGRPLYLYGLIFAQKGNRERAITLLEEAVKEDNSIGKAYFMLFKLYSLNHNQVKVLDCLSHCCRLDYRKQFCLRKRIRLSYRSGDFVAANNLIEDFRKEFSDSRSLKYLKIESLARLNLIDEAERIGFSLDAKHNRAKKTVSYLQNLFTSEKSNPYRELYQKNAEYFGKRFGLSCPPYNRLQYKVCRFLSGEFVYSNQSGAILSGVNHVRDNDFPISENDIVAIFNTDNSKIFDHLLDIFNRFQSRQYREKMAMVPVFIIEQDPEQWYFIAQLFDFSWLDDWKNIHLFLLKSEDLIKLFLEDTTPYPNILHSTDPKQMENIISYAHNKKDDLFMKRYHELLEYYREYQYQTPRKILILGSVTDEGLMVYGKSFQSFFEKMGLECVFASESPPFFKRTIYRDGKLLHEFRPDLVISMIGIQEELELYKELNIPFISWLQFERKLTLDKAKVFPNQRFWTTGNIDIEPQLTAAGYSRDRVVKVPLPVLPVVENTGDLPVGNGIGIFADLADLEEIVGNMEIVICGLFYDKGIIVNKPDIVAAIMSLYVSLYMRLNNEGLKYYDVSVYEEVLADNLKRRNLQLEAGQIKSVAPLIKNEFDNLLLTQLQVKWVINDFQSYGIEIFGSGWGKDPACLPFYKGENNSISHLAEFCKAVRGNKVNLYPGIQINNKSYMQPDLINGIAAGGFFLVNNLWTEKYGGSAMKAFGGMLETYGSKPELIGKVKYFMEHENERLQKIQYLRDYIIKHFSFEKLGELVLSPIK
jgi:hypothetical protein